jgi:hypothetical protein
VDESYERPVTSRYVDPLELVWLATAKRLGLTVRRNAEIFSATDGTGLLELGPRGDLDADDAVAQMIFHEICHWITNGADTVAERDWGFALDGLGDPREPAGLRVQAALADSIGLRSFLGPTGFFRQYYDRIPANPLQPIDDSEREAQVVALAIDALDRSAGPPWAPHLQQALAATERFKDTVDRFLGDYQTDLDQDELPSLWAQDPPAASRGLPSTRCDTST